MKTTTYKLGEIATFIDYRGKTPIKTNSGIPLITAKIVKNGIIEPPTEFINPKDYESWMTRGYPEVGDVVLTTEAPLGEVAQLKSKNVALAQRIITLRGNRKLLSNTYLKYFFISPKGQALLRSRETGTTVIGIKSAELKELEIDLPSLNEQEHIATILSTLDDKIANNVAINRNLEEQARAIFKSWFIDFEPFRDGEFFDSELGPLPKGWRSGTLGDLAEVNPRRSMPKDTVARVIEMANIPTQGPCPVAWEWKPYSGGTKFMNGDTLIARITPCLENGKTAYINFLDKDEVAFGSTEYVVLSARGGSHSEFLYFVARDNAFREYAIKNMNGSSGRQRVSAQTVADYQMPIPPRDILESFTQIVSSIMRIIKENSLQNIKLAAMRDTLLPKLMSGEIDVSAVEV